MTFREIIDREDQNTDSIWLYREGMFMKAYERSAFFAHTLIHEFLLNGSLMLDIFPTLVIVYVRIERVCLAR